KQEEPRNWRTQQRPRRGLTEHDGPPEIHRGGAGKKRPTGSKTQPGLRVVSRCR
ncbi:hypothetical protein A2U01_0029595, partial [Trifolium medium]|nr:hypothetical protein [Trifolium medium]